jgi:hypothetical protein
VDSVLWREVGNHGRRVALVDMEVEPVLWLGVEDHGLFVVGRQNEGKGSWCVNYM